MNETRGLLVLLPILFSCGPPAQCFGPNNPPNKSPVNVCINNPSVCEACGTRYEIPDSGVHVK